jgi:hypothetical protein
LAEQGFFCKELNIGWKEWTANRHPTHAGLIEGPWCGCSKRF